MMIDLSQPTAMPSVTTVREGTMIMEGRAMVASAPTETEGTGTKTNIKTEGMRGHPTAGRRSDSQATTIIKTSITMKRT